MLSTSTKREELLEAATKLCTLFANKAPLSEVTVLFASATSLYEHGLPDKVPFVGKAFDSPTVYFTIISDLLDYQNMAFSDYVVDEISNIVCVRGRATFTWKSTERAWDEQFTYRLAYDPDMKITSYEVWADPLAAYLASQG